MAGLQPPPASIAAAVEHRRGTGAVVIAIVWHLPAYLPGTGNWLSCAGSYGSGISLTPSTAQRPPRHSSVL